VREVIAAGPRSYGLYQENDRRDLVEAILAYNRTTSRSARRLGPGHVMLLHGSAEGLTLLADALVAGGTLVSEWPAYRIIRERVWQAGGTVVDVPLDARSRGPDYAALRAALQAHPETGLVHFNAQNNPIGTVLLRGEFDAFAEHVFRNHPRTIILVDDSDPEFMEPGQADLMPDFLSYVARGKNLVHLQTFSHAFALTGLRIGYLMAPRRLIRRMRAKRLPHPTSIFAHAAALASLRDRRAQIRRSYDNCHEGRQYLYGELDRMGLNYLSSQGQYVMVDTGVSGTAVWAALIAQGVLTRYGREWGMESFIRVNPGLPDENERFIASLRTVLARPDLSNPPTPPVPLPGGEATAGLRADLERRLRRDTWIQSRMPPLERPYRVTPADAFRR
jgi:histidinol-phosphate aminotransferase